MTDTSPVDRRVLSDLPEGVYFSLDESSYFNDIAIGSTDLRVLSYSPSDYWFGSKFNPLREEKETTPAQLYGRAVHTLILEGEARFRAMYAPKRLSWSTKEGKAERTRFEDEGFLPLPEDAWTRALQTGRILRGNQYLAEAFEGSVGHEVSVFWRRDGMKFRARFDALKERSIVDLKNVSNERAIAFPSACLRKINDFSYHIQAELYSEGRLQMRRLAAEGKVFGDHDASDLTVAAHNTSFYFVWIFLQSSGAPIIWATQLSRSPRNQMFDLGRLLIDRAEANWKKFHGMFGYDLPWVSEEPIEEFNVDKMPGWFLRSDEGGM